LAKAAATTISFVTEHDFQGGLWMNTAAILIGISLLLLAGLGIAGLFLAGRESRAANADDPPPRD
jgi:hypothetical protein